MNYPPPKTPFSEYGPGSNTKLIKIDHRTPKISGAMQGICRSWHQRSKGDAYIKSIFDVLMAGTAWKDSDFFLYLWPLLYHLLAVVRCVPRERGMVLTESHGRSSNQTPLDLRRHVHELP
jgi:hypothetical protein